MKEPKDTKHSTIKSKKKSKSLHRTTKKKAPVKRRAKKIIQPILKKDPLLDNVGIFQELTIKGKTYYANVTKNKSYIYEKTHKNNVVRCGGILKGKPYLFIPPKLTMKIPKNYERICVD